MPDTTRSLHVNDMESNDTKDQDKEESFNITNEEFFVQSRRLEKFHAIFYQLWEFGRVRFTKEISTAAVYFNPDGRAIDFVFNPDLWKKSSPEKRDFIICHECLHVILKHGIRIKDTKNRDNCNIALDVVVNHLLVNRFGFKRQEIDPDLEYCWIDTVFANPAVRGKFAEKIEAEQSFEYYYNRLKYNDNNKPSLVDIHDNLNGEESNEAIKRLNRSLTDDEKEKIRDIIEKHYTSKGEEDSGPSWQFMDKNPVPIKKKWETVIKDWSRKYLTNDFGSFEHWARVNPRISDLLGDCVLPSDMELQEKEEMGRISVHFFLDTSGSCKSLAPRFWTAARSLPRSRFDVKLYCFDTKVYDVDEKVGKLYGGGGTSFKIIEKHIQHERLPKLKKECLLPYPEAVFIITDGYGDKVQPILPARWHWFLTSTHRSCIPEKSHVYNLKDFE